jgi:hypothetical protein
MFFVPFIQVGKSTLAADARVTWPSPSTRCMRPRVTAFNAETGELNSDAADSLSVMTPEVRFSDFKRVKWQWRLALHAAC